LSFGEYMRWEGCAAIVVGAAMIVLGAFEGHEGAVDTASSGAIMVAGTGLFMRFRHRVTFLAAGAWFTTTPMATAAPGAAICPRRVLLVALIGEATAMAVIAVGLSILSGSWLTYMDCGVWAVVVGAIKLGPARSVIARDEGRHGVTYLVARRRVRGLVELSLPSDPAGRS
jgi:hypothetical protein